MRILFDHGAPAPLIPFLAGHAVTKAKDAGWDRLVNGELLNAAGLKGWDFDCPPALYIIGCFEVARAGLATSFSPAELARMFQNNFHVMHPDVFED